MSSAEAYEPDDFDNNPFAEQSVIMPSDSGDKKPLPEVPDTTTSPSANDEPATTNENVTVSKDDSETVKPFHDTPTEQDLKKYLPERINKNGYRMRVKVEEVEKNGNNTYKNPVFRLNMKVDNIPGFRKHSYRDVRRTYKEIKNLYKYLIYNNIEVFVPALPAIVTTLKVLSPEFIHVVCGSMQEWFNRICANNILIRNQEFVLFFEQNDFSYTPSKTKPSSNSVMATGLRRKTLKQLQPPYDACEELAEYRPMIKSVHIQAACLADKLEELMRLQRQCIRLSSDFYPQLAGLSTSSQDQAMPKMWKKLDKVMQVYAEMTLVGNVSMDSTMISNFKLIADDCYNIKESLTNRHLLMREYLSSKEATAKKHATITRFKSKSIIDPVKIDEAIRELELANNYEKELRYEVKRTTYEMILESRDYTAYMTKLISNLFKAIFEQQIAQERKKLHLLETNKLISPQESLGRLGRETQPTNSTSPTKPRGDSWSSRKHPSLGNIHSSPVPIAGVEDLDITGVNAKNAANVLAGSSF